MHNSYCKFKNFSTGNKHKGTQRVNVNNRAQYVVRIEIYQFKIFICFSGSCDLDMEPRLHVGLPLIPSPPPVRNREEPDEVDNSVRTFQ